MDKKIILDIIQSLGNDCKLIAVSKTKPVDMIKEAYTNEKELRLHGELLALNQNISDTLDYLESTTTEDQPSNDDLSLDKNSTLVDKLGYYKDSVSRFISANFKNHVK